jgi:hypothetical protein
MKRLVVIILVSSILALPTALWAEFLPQGNPVFNTTKVCQLTGGEDRGSPGKLTGTQLSGVTGGITGTDLGFPFEYNRRLNFLFGDSREFPPDLCEPFLCGTESDPKSVIQPNPEKVQRWRSQGEWDSFVALRGDGRDSTATTPLEFNPEQCIPVTFETTEVGLIFAHAITDNDIGIPFQLIGQNVAANPQDKWVLIQNNRILVITKEGLVFAHDIIGNNIGIPFQLSGPKVAANPQDKWVLIQNNRILVITIEGLVFAHDIIGNNIGIPFQLSGPKVAANPQDKWVLIQNNRILVITKDGLVFAHDIIGNNIGIPFQLSGPKVAANPRDVRLLVQGRKVLILTGQDGTFRATRLNERFLGRKEGAIGSFIDKKTIYAFFTLRDRAPGCTNNLGCAHDDEQPGGKLVLAKSITADGNFREITLVSKTKFLWAVPIVENVTKIPWLPESIKDQVVLVWGSGRENNEKGDHVAPWNHSFPFLAVAPLSKVVQKENWRYFTGFKSNGQPNWQQDEALAKPLPPFGSPRFGPGFHECLGYFSVRFIEGWGKWVMLYTCSDEQTNGARGIYLRTANVPWGPWSNPHLIFSPMNGKGYCNFMHNQRSDENNECNNKGVNPAEESVREIKDGTNRRAWGGEYAPFLLPSRYAKVLAEGTTLYFLMSTWNPYQVVLMRTQVKVSP